MRPTLALVCLSILGLFGCDGGDLPVFADFRYSTRCDDSGGCSGEQQRDVCGDNTAACPELDGVAPPSITCQIVETADTRTIGFVTAGAGFSVGITQLVVPIAGGPGGGPNCTVTVRDGPNTYTGRCGSSPVSEAQPCQISAVTFRDDMGNPTVDGNLICRNLEHSASPTLRLELSAPGSGSTVEMTPATWRIANCDGLQLE